MQRLRHPGVEQKSMTHGLCQNLCPPKIWASFGRAVGKNHQILPVTVSDTIQGRYIRTGNPNCVFVEEKANFLRVYRDVLYVIRFALSKTDLVFSTVPSYHSWGRWYVTSHSTLDTI